MLIDRRSVAALLALAASPIALADDPGPARDEPHPLVVRVGEGVAICKTGTIVCPATNPICDDMSVAVGELTDDGLVFRGMSPGVTLCSAQASSGQGPRRVYRVRVVAKKDASSR